MLQMGPGRDELTAIERHRPFGHMALAHEDGVVLALRQVEELLAQRAREAQLALGAMKPMEAMEHLEALQRLPHLVAQRLGSGVDLAHFWSRHAVRRDELLPQHEQQCEFVVGALGAVGECREERQPFGDGGDGVVMGMTPGGSVPACCQ